MLNGTKMNNDLEERMKMYRNPVQPHYKRRRQQKPKSRFPKFLIIVGAILAVIFAFVNHQIGVGYTPNKASIHSPIDLNFNFSPRRQNILLMGIDVASNSSNPFKGNRSDTMLVISIAPYGKNINIISIPRDSKVYLAGKNRIDKINHAFAYGGARLAVRTVEETFGIRVHNYLAVSNEGVINLIDTLGGLPIYIEKDMKYDDNTAKLHINLKQGHNVLSGKQTEGYLRFRHDSYGDIGRIRRQQWFFSALLSRLKDPTVIVKLPELLKIMPQYIQTDLSGYDLAKYLGMAKNIDMSTVQVATIPGAPSTKGVISYWIIDPEKTQDLINKMVYRNKSDIETKNLSIGVLYSNSRAAKANSIRQELVDKGIAEVKMQEGTGLAKSYIAIHNLDVTGDVVNEMKKLIPQIKDEHTIYDPIGINKVGKDLTIIVSGS